MKFEDKWTDISLEELYTSSPDAEDRPSLSGSVTSQYPQAQRSRTMSRNKMWAGIVLGVCGLATIATASVMASSGSEGRVPEFQSWDSKMARQEPEICITEECVIAAAHIIESMDETADPCEDFFQFSCGGWIEDNVIPESKSKWGKFYELREAVDQAVREIVESPIDEANDAQAVKSMKNTYQGCMNVDAIEAAGNRIFLDLAIDEFGGWPMIQENWDASQFATERIAGDNSRKWLSSTLISVYAYLDSFDTSQNILYIDQTSLALPRDFYVEPENYGEYIAAYKAYIVDVARVLAAEAGEVVDEINLTVAAENIFTFESKLAIGVVPDSERRNATEMYNPLTYAELKTTYPIFWSEYFERLFVDTDIVLDDSETVIVVEPEYFDWLLPMLIATPERILADYLYWNRIMSMVGEGPKELRDIEFKFTSILYGQSAPSPRWSTCVSKASREDQGFAYAVGSEYISQEFDDQTRTDADALVTDLRVAFKELVTESIWMDADTQVLAEEKADAIIQLVGYPDWIVDAQELDTRYETFPITSASNHFGNMKDTMYAYQALSLNNLRKTPDRNEWITQPAIVNAFYSPSFNTISFPAGILQPPFFGKGYPRYVNYGAIGVVMGHEITHGFDDQGRQYDGSGSITQWWSDETINAFANQVQCYIDQYESYAVDELVGQLGEDAHLNGKATQGENVADNGGLHEAFRAYQNSVDNLGPEGALPGLEQYTSEQMFFVAYAQVWCEKQTPSGLLNQVLTDPHSPGKFRVWGPVSNSPDFVSAFNCPAGANMNRPNKCVLW